MAAEVSKVTTPDPDRTRRSTPGARVAMCRRDSPARHLIRRRRVNESSAPLRWVGNQRRRPLCSGLRGNKIRLPSPPPPPATSLLSLSLSLSTALVRDDRRSLLLATTFGGARGSGDDGRGSNGGQGAAIGFGLEKLDSPHRSVNLPLHACPVPLYPCTEGKNGVRFRRR